jgi:ADP-ribose pyrophosphatase
VLPVSSPPKDPYEHLRWAEVSREVAFRCTLFDVIRTGRRPAEADARHSDFYVLDAHDWVTVVPVLEPGTAAESFLMVRQYRHGIEAITLEFPAGLVEPGEPPEAAARRELLEETGHEASALAHAATMGAAPAFMNNRCHVFIAWGLRRTRDQALDTGERIEFRSVPVDEVSRDMGTGELVNSVTAMSHWFYQRWKGADRIRTGA